MTDNKHPQPAEFKSGDNFSDGSDTLANVYGQIIEIYHLPSKSSVKFKAFLTAFTDQYSSDWSSEDVLGRMDPIQTFKGTKRTISLGWDVPAGSFEEARTNLKKASLLLSMLYPEYDGANETGGQGGGATTMSSPPLFKVKFMNLIQDSSQKSAPMGSAQTTGLLGTISGFTYEPDLESGFFQPSLNYVPNLEPWQEGPRITNDTTFADFKKLIGPDADKLFPQTIKFQCEFTVLHQHKLGWQKGSGIQNKTGQGFRTFPYSNLHEGDNGAALPEQESNVAPQSSGKTKSKNDRNRAAAEKELTTTMTSRLPEA
jgi:hypothetical protein